MAEVNKYAVTYDELERRAHVPREDQVEETDVTPPVPDNELSAGHLPGNVRPFAV